MKAMERSMTLEEYEAYLIAKRSKRFGRKFCTRNIFGAVSVASALIILLDGVFLKSWIYFTRGTERIFGGMVHTGYTHRIDRKSYWSWLSWHFEQPKLQEAQNETLKTA